jgi:hypothetical protein
VKKERKPPKKWRRNMVTAAGLLGLLDAVIVSGSPSQVRVELALAVTVLVGFLIVRIWRSNIAIEKSAAAAEQQQQQKKGKKK